MARKTIVRTHRRRLKNKTVKVKTHKRTVKIRPRERRLFSVASRPYNKKEFGGYIDFNKTGVERFTTEVGGGEDEIMLPDYEVLWHTHPDALPNPASPEDVATLLKNDNQKAEIIFNNGRAFIVTKTPQTKKLEKKPEKELVKHYEKMFNNAMKKGPNDFYKEYARQLRRDGFSVKTEGDDDRTIVFNKVGVRN